MAPPKDIARSYPKRGLTADVGFRSEPKFCGDGSIQLDGSNQYLNAELSSALGDSFTIMGWAKREGTSPTLDYIVNAGSPSGAGNAISISITNANPGVLYFFDNGTSVNTSNTVDFNEWFHFALTVAPGAGNVKLYKNGIDGTPSNSVAVDLSDVTFEVGRYLGNNHYLQGKLFDLRVYDETLTQDQIRELLNNPGQTVPTGLTSADLIHRYLFETDTNDSGATGNNLTANNSPTFGVDRAQLPRGLDLARGAGQARVKTGRCVDFDGSADGLASTATLNINTSGAKATLSCWVNPDVSTAGNKTIVSNAIDTNNNQFTIYQNGTSYAVSAVYASGFTKVNHFADSQVKVEAWTFLCAVWDFDTTSLTFYVNGTSFTDTPSTAIGSTNGVFEIGCRDPAGSKSQIFNGQIASIKLFDTTLTAAQVRELYHNPERVLPTGVSASNLRRYYPLSDYNDTGGTGGRYFQDMGTDGKAAESKGSSLMTFAQSVPCPQLGLQQSATRLYFPGATTQTSATIPALGATASISAWFFWDDSARVSYVTSVGDAGSNTNGLNIRINTSGDVTTNLNGEFDSGLNVTEGTWNHIVVTTQSSSPYWKCFVNNVEASSPAALTGAINITATNAEIGANNFNFGAAGIIADAAIWTSELSDSNVAALYNSGVMGADVSQVDSSNLIAWWKCDDLTSCKDFSGNGRSMTITTALNAASFPENASGSTIVGDFSMKRKGVSILNHAGADDATAIIPAQEAVYPKAGAANGYTIGFCYRKIKDGTAMVWGNTGASVNDQFMCFQQVGAALRFNLGDGSSRPAVTTSALTDSDWHHYTLTISYATTPAEVKIYVDGAVDHSSTQSITGPPALHPMHLGTGFFDGQGPVGCFKFYHVALSADEVKRLAFSDLRLIKGLANE